MLKDHIEDFSWKLIQRARHDDLENSEYRTLNHFSLRLNCESISTEKESNGR